MNAFQPADILLPKDADMEKWSVIACDQYTSNSKYWKRVEDFVGDARSTLNLILPEIYLNDMPEKRIEKINSEMADCLSSDVFRVIEDSYVYLERTLLSGAVRKGIIGKIDLEKYDYTPGSQTPVRATESTIVDRLPPRIKIRENAPIELPHVMILIDDRAKTVIEPCENIKAERELLYSFELMENGGHIEAYKLNAEDEKRITEALEALASPETFFNNYGVKDASVLEYAVGDGNHSLATAKACYEKLKNKIGEEKAKSSPARYALCEIVNLHEDALVFEPIHRIITNTDQTVLFTEMKDFFNGNLTVSDTAPEGDGQTFEVVTAEKTVFVTLTEPPKNITVGSLQAFLDVFVKETGCEIDYIHGEKDVYELVKENGTTVGFLLPKPEKNDLFKTVIVDGVLPRKTFSMGHAEEKRYYIEARKIK